MAVPLCAIKKYESQNVGRSCRNKTFQLRYFECTPPGVRWQKGDPVLFYCGNENKVELYVHLTGLMWESAHVWNAKLIFAEHRFFGKSYPFSKDGIFDPTSPDMSHPSKMKLLTTELALQDFSMLIRDLKAQDGSPTSAYIGFGGSYGGMLCSWFRFKYPESIQGCIAGSAPILDFEGMDPPYDPTGFSKQATFDATEAGGSARGCDVAIKRGWDVIKATPLPKLQEYFRFCDEPTSTEVVRDYLNEIMGNFAMGSYPFPSNYMTWGNFNLPPYPLRLGCDILMKHDTSQDEALLRGLGDFGALYSNVTKTETCFPLGGEPQDAGWMALWEVLSCNSMIMPAASNGKTDMFWEEPWDTDAWKKHCWEAYSLNPDIRWVRDSFGPGMNLWAEKTSNIVFSSGELDPWIMGSPVHNVSDSIVAVIIPQNGHHADLMFRHEQDTPETLRVRDFERQKIGEWIHQHALRWAHVENDVASDGRELDAKVFYS